MWQKCTSLSRANNFLISKLAHSHHDYDMVYTNTRYLCFMKLYATAYRNFTNKKDVKPLYSNVERHLSRNAIIDKNGVHTYKELLYMANKLSKKILSILSCRKSDLIDKTMLPRIVILCPNNMSYVMTLCSIWMTRGIAVPLNKTYPLKELEYFISDSKPDIIITTKEYKEDISCLVKKTNISVVCLEENDYNLTLERKLIFFIVMKLLG